MVGSSYVIGVMNQSLRALYQELKTDALPSLGEPEQDHPEIFGVILEF